MEQECEPTSWFSQQEEMASFEVFVNSVSDRMNRSIKNKILWNATRGVSKVTKHFDTIETDFQYPICVFLVSYPIKCVGILANLIVDLSLNGGIINATKIASKEMNIDLKVTCSHDLIATDKFVYSNSYNSKGLFQPSTLFWTKEIFFFFFHGGLRSV